MKSTPRWTWGQLDYEDQLPNKNIHKNSSIHSYFRQLRHIGIEKKKLKKRQKKLSLFSILFFLELLSENQRLLTMTNLPSKPQTVSKPKHFIRFYSVGVFYLLLLSCQPFFAQELCRLPNWISVVGWNRQARLNGSPGVQHPHNVNQASEKTSRKPTYTLTIPHHRYARVYSSHYYKCNPWYHSS